MKFPRISICVNPSTIIFHSFHLSSSKMLTLRFFLLTANVGRTSRSLSTNDNRRTHSNAHSPSVGSFQVFSRQLEFSTDPRLKVLTQTSQRGQVDVQDDGMDVGGHNSPKRKKVPQKNVDLENVIEQVVTPTSTDNLKNTYGNATNSPEGQGMEATVGKASSHERGSSQRSRGKNVDTGAAKGSRSPKHRRGVVTEVGVDKPSPKRRRGVHKIMHVEKIHCDPRDSKKMDEFEDGSDEEGTGSDSARAEGGEESEHHGGMDPGEGEERSPTAAKVSGKKERLGRGGKKPIAERLSVSRVTRAAKGATPK